MKQILLIAFIFSICFGQVKTVQDVMNEVLDDDNDALQSNMVAHYANDGMFNAVVIVDHEITSLNTGEAFNYAYKDPDLDDVDSLIIAFVTPNSDKDIHLEYQIRINLAATYYLLEAPTMNSGKGTNAVLIQMNRTSSDTTTIKSSKDATIGSITYNSVGDITVLGTVLDSFTFSAVNQEFVSDEWILNTNTLYALLLISETNEAVASIKIKIIEHTPDND